MALFAKDGTEIISAWDAEIGSVYSCAECQSKVKARRGKRQFPHFFHLKSAPQCRLYSKSERHLIIQKHIQKLLPDGEAILEKHYPSIHRIADLSWENQNLVFEIQCSPIAEKEAKERISEYRSIGLEIVWILDERIFNKKHLLPAEGELRKCLCYFVAGKNAFHFYDQFEIIRGNRRLKKSEKMIVDISSLQTLSEKHLPKILPKQIENRIRETKKYFPNDIVAKTLSSIYTKTLSYWRSQELQIPEKTSIKTFLKFFFESCVKDPYLAIINQLLRM